MSFELGKHESRNIYVTTIGRVSGLPREIEIWFVTLNGKYFILAENFRSHWVRNIERNARVKVRIGYQRFDATARVLDERKDAWRVIRPMLRRARYRQAKRLKAIMPHSKARMRRPLHG
jgi:deazaflavin-dependent oxidoreductase (nitroreductase family)